MAGRPKGSKNSVSTKENRPVFADKRFVGKSLDLFLTVSKVYLHKPEKDSEEDPELRFEIKSQPLGHSGTKVFEIPVSAINCLRNALSSYLIYEEEAAFQARVSVRQEEIRIWLGEWKDTGWGSWKGLLCLILPLGGENPISWLDDLLSKIEAEYGDTKVIASTSLDEMNAVVQAAAA